MRTTNTNVIDAPQMTAPHTSTPDTSTPHASTDGSGLTDLSERRELDDYRLMLGTTAAVTILLVDASGLMQRVTGGVVRMLGWSAAELVGRPVAMLHLASDIESDGDVASWPTQYLAAGVNGRTWTFVRKDGTSLFVALEVAAASTQRQSATSADDSPSAFVVTVTDVSAAVGHASDLRRDSDLSADVVEHVPALVVVCRSDGTVVRFNEAGEKFTGRKAQDVVGKPVWDILMPARDGNPRDQWNDVLAKAAPTFRTETLLTDANGRTHDIRFRVRRLPARDGTPEHVVIVGHDITADRRGERALRRAAETDSLTGLVNRPGLAAALQHFVSSGASRTAGHLLFADLDNFKAVNDAHGHAIGDLVLAEIGNRLRATVRRRDVVARFGGDEFIVFCPGLGAIEAHELGLRLREAVRAPIGTLDGEVRVSVSIGAVPVAPGDDWRELLAIADRQMYDEKRLGQARASV